MYEEIFNEKLTVGTFDGGQKMKLKQSRSRYTYAYTRVSIVTEICQYLLNIEKYFLDDNAVAIKQEAIKQ